MLSPMGRSMSAGSNSTTSSARDGGTDSSTSSTRLPCGSMMQRPRPSRISCFAISDMSTDFPEPVIPMIYAWRRRSSEVIRTTVSTPRNTLCPRTIPSSGILGGGAAGGQPEDVGRLGLGQREMIDARELFGVQDEFVMFVEIAVNKIADYRTLASHAARMKSVAVLIHVVLPERIGDVIEQHARPLRFLRAHHDSHVRIHARLGRFLFNAFDNLFLHRRQAVRLLVVISHPLVFSLAFRNGFAAIGGSHHVLDASSRRAGERT